MDEDKPSSAYKPAPPSAIPIDIRHHTDATHDANGIRLGAWSAEICGCFTDCVPNCCMAYCLPCISVAQIAHRINVARYSLVLIVFLVLTLTMVALAAFSFSAAYSQAQKNTNSVFHSYYRGDYNSYHLEVSSTSVAFGSTAQLINFAVSLLYLVLIWQLRAKVRARFQIPGNCCEDCCCVWWCSCCTIAQMATHVKSYKPGSCDFGPPDMLPAYE